MQLFQLLKDSIQSAEDPMELINSIRGLIHGLSPVKEMPVDFVQWIPVDKIQANDYNPNSVAGKEMGLLYTSIKHDGYTQPIVTIYDPEIDKYVIIDGFHRYFTGKSNPDIMKSTSGCLPCVVLQKNINDRMASTVRHNRARGSHSVDGMSNIVYEMLKNGWKDHDICNEMGMEKEELIRLKHMTGFSKLFEGAEYNKAWKDPEQIKLDKKEGMLGKHK